MTDSSLRRRHFLAMLAAAAGMPRRGTAMARYPVHFRKASPYESVFQYIEAGQDAFRDEQEAEKIESRLRSMLTSRTLPLSGDFRGKSPLPSRYRPVAEAVSEAEFDPDNTAFSDGLRQWIQSLGTVRRASFFALPDHRVRFEIASQGAYRNGVWKMHWQAGQLQEFEPVTETLVQAAQPRFRDCTRHCLAAVNSFDRQLLKGNSWWRSQLDSATGIDLYGSNGIAVGDIDNDGWDEIYVCQPGGLPNLLFKNDGAGRMLDITEKAAVGILDDTTCALFIDFRNTGHQDLVVLRAAGPLLFSNRGDGTFEHRPDAFRFQTPPQGSFTGMAAADYDRDGKVDLYLCCYVYFQSEDQYRYPAPYHDAENGPPNFLFRNRLTESGGWFEDVTAETGMNENNNRYSFAPSWCDFDGDGWPDLYVANDFGRKNLYRNHEGKFRDEAAMAGVEDTGPGMSAAWFDYDGDGRPDLYVSNMWTAPGQRVVADPAFEPARDLKEAYRRHTKGNSLYRNRGDGTFEETGAAEGVEMGRWAWGADAFDFDHDGAPEIYITAGMLTNSSEKDLSSFFWRQVVAKSPGVKKPAPDYENGWNTINQLIREDYSWCGREPNVLYVRPAPLAGEKARFYDFSGVSGLDFAEDSRAFAAADWDGDGNLDIVLKSRLAPQIRMLQNQCGRGKRVIAIRLRGTKSNRDAIGARVEVNGRVQYLSAGSGYLSQHTKQLHFGIGDSETTAVKITWPSGLRQELKNLRAGFRHTITEGVEKFSSEPFRARPEIDSGARLAAENEPEFTSTWLLEPVPLPDQRKGPGFLLVTAGETALPAGVPVETVDLRSAPSDLAAHYSIFRRYLFDLRADFELPMLLLIDGRSLAHKIYFDIPRAEILAADLRTLREGRGAELAIPFSGRYYTQPRRNYFKLGAAFYWAGYPDQAIPYLTEVVRRSPDNWKAFYALGQIHEEAERWQQALENYERTLALHPHYPPALLGAGEVHARLNQFPAAEKLLRQALAADPENADSANQLGLVLAQQSRDSEAKEMFQRAISLHREHTGAINNLAVLYVKMGRPQEAIAAFQYGIEVAPDDESLYLNLGRLYVTLGRREKARELMLKLLERKPGNPVAIRALAELESR